ncbi:CD109 antigen-like [Ylistrum balloti]|uniref:CD109 antigen-like n=1 Tax=Ylistrum balloti TaxID=509963 RepID=UPI0029059FCA|nr:CD109 antigen-like [Ylistrum balloti]
MTDKRCTKKDKQVMTDKKVYKEGQTGNDRQKEYKVGQTGNDRQKVYKEGQKVHIRGAVISSVTKPLDSNLDIIIKDPKGNKLAHYKGVTPNLGVVSTDFKLVNDPAYGEWTIFIMATNTPEITATETFKVEKYVLPKFSVDVTVPSFIKLYPGQNAGILTVDILAKYTYGKSVNGKAIVQVTSNSQHELLEKTLVNGQSSFSFTVTREHVSRWLNYQASVLVRVVEDVTAKVESAEKSVPMFMMPYKITFINDDGSFIYGMPRNIFVKVTDAAGGSIPSAERSALGVSVTFALSKNWVPNADLLPPLTLTMPDTGDVISAHVDIPTRLEMDNQTFSMMAELSYPSTTSQKNEKVTTETEYKYPIGTKTNHGISVGVVGVTNQKSSPTHLGERLSEQLYFPQAVLSRQEINDN